MDSHSCDSRTGEDGDGNCTQNRTEYQRNAACLIVLRC